MDSPQFSTRTVTELLVLPLRHPWVMTASLLVCLGAAIVTSFVLQERFRSTTVILVERSRIPEDVVPQLVTERSRNRLATLKQEVLSRTRIERVLEELNPYPELESRATSNDLVDRVRSSTSIRVRGNDAFVLEFSHHSPTMAQRVTERLASLFIEEASQSRSRQVEDASAFIEEELEAARGELVAKEEALRAFKERYMGSLPEQLNANLATLRRLQLEQQGVEQSLQSARQRELELQKSLVERARGGAGDGDPAALAPNAQILQLRRELDALLARYTEQHPDVIALRARIARLEDRVARTAGDAVSEDPIDASFRERVMQAKLEVERLEQRHEEYTERLAALQWRVDQTPRTEQELASLTRDYNELRENYTALLKRKLDADMAGSLERRWKGEEFRVLDPANLPVEPHFPPRRWIVLAGLCLGLGIGFGLSFASEALSETVKNEDELQSLLPFPVLVVVPHSVGRRGRSDAPAAAQHRIH